MAVDNVKRESQRKRRKRIALDFDGVLHKYSRKWHDGTIYDAPVKGAVEAVKELAERFDLIIFTCREQPDEIKTWVKEHFGLDIAVTCGKPHADMYIDDRGYHFDGSWQRALAEVKRRDEYYAFHLPVYADVTREELFQRGIEEARDGS